jgi:hypothetical protein
MAEDNLEVSVNSDKDGEITTYNEMLKYITKDDNSDTKWKF